MKQYVKVKLYSKFYIGKVDVVKNELLSLSPNDNLTKVLEALSTNKDLNVKDVKVKFKKKELLNRESALGNLRKLTKNNLVKNGLRKAIELRLIDWTKLKGWLDNERLTLDKLLKKLSVDNIDKLERENDSRVTFNINEVITIYKNETINVYGEDSFNKLSSLIRRKGDGSNIKGIR